MAGAFVRVEINDQAIREVFKSLISAGENIRPALVDIGEHLVLSHHLRFQEQVSPEGIPWEPLSPQYKARKKKNHDLILVHDGYLRDKLTYQVDDNELRFGSNEVYAAAQNFGFEARNLPARPFLGLSADDKDEVVAILGEHLAKVLP